ncbi:hypothetical protein P3393_18100 [Vibrio parahaemolyticus]|nr:hypothetical protein [Vibrio parahaemolyticus]
MRVTSFIYRIAAVFGLVFALAACSDEGPMEKAGKKLDETAEEAQNAEESPNDFDKNHQVKVDAHLVV